MCYPFSSSVIIFFLKTSLSDMNIVPTSFMCLYPLYILTIFFLILIFLLRADKWSSTLSQDVETDQSCRPKA